MRLRAGKLRLPGILARVRDGTEVLDITQR